MSTQAAYSSLRIRATGLVAAAKILTKNLRVAATATALDRLIWDPKDHRKYTDDEVTAGADRQIESAHLVVSRLSRAVRCFCQSAFESQQWHAEWLHLRSR